MAKNIYTIPPEAAFIDRLAEGLWKQAGGDPFKLADMLVLLPTRRACRTLREAFPKITGKRAVLLPRMQPLGDIDETELYFAADLNPDIPPAIAPLRRQMLLARLIQQKDRNMPLDQAAQLAEALAKFLDETQIERRDFADLKNLVPENLAIHWQETIEFLKIVTEAWPAVLKDEGAIDPALRRNHVIGMQAEAWCTKPPAFPVVAAGSTGSQPVTADLLDVIAALPTGAVILPGLDQALDEEAWQAIDETHPQFTMKHWLEKSGVKRSDVKAWTPNTKPNPRTRLLQESMRPAEVSDAWRELDQKKIPRSALHGLSRLTLDNAQEEAQAIALIMRGVLEVPDKTAALVTADRGLAERVRAQLARWNIAINDSAGCSLASQPVGSFMLDLLAAAGPDATAIDYLTLLKHPYAACGLDAGVCRGKARDAEILLYRKQRVDKNQKAEIKKWFDAFKQKLQPLSKDWRKLLPLADRLRAHIDIAEQLAASDKETGSTRLWRDEFGEAAATWCDEWQNAAKGFPPLTGDDYANLFSGFLRAVTVRPKYGQHPRLSILGLLEARLVQADVMIMGGLNEGVWPPEAAVDPWMSRPMKTQFGLPLPERRIGLSAHDFVQIASAPEVILTRARRAGNAPTVPSRFLLQLETVLQALGFDDAALDAKEPWVEWTRMLDEPAAAPKPCDAPAPCPPKDARPKGLHVTEIGTWRRNPYAIYAKHILGLEKLDPIEEDPTAADKGIIIHAALEKFLQKYSDELPANAEDELLKIGRAEFAPYQDEPQVAAFWWPRFERIAAWFIANEHERRGEGIKHLKSEASGTINLVNDFTLRGRADRIDALPDGMLAIIDYKTGGVPRKKDVEAGIEPQLPLLALIASQGGFEGIKPAQTSQLSYWKLSGGADPAEETDIGKDVASLVNAARTGLENLIVKFADAKTPYLAVPKSGLQPRFDDYAHLARLAEWGRTAEDA